MNPTNEQELDEILNMLGERHIMVEHRLIHVGMPERNGKNIETRNAKQAIIDWHNKQTLELLDRIDSKAAYDPSGTSPLINPREIEAERNKLKEQSDE